jgi:hypothetical protein
MLNQDRKKNPDRKKTRSKNKCSLSAIETVASFGG